MPGILHTHLWGADNSSPISLEASASWLLTPAGVSSFLQGQEVLTSLILSVKDFGAGNELQLMPSGAPRIINAVSSLTCLMAKLQTSNQRGRVLERHFLS